MEKQRVLRIIENFKNKKILVIGDIILDSYLYGDIERISPEAPIMVVEAKDRKYRLGGAANVALNIASLSGSPTLLGFIGKDKDGEIITEIAKRKGIRFVPAYSKKTIKKTRVVSNDQQVLRIDEEETANKYFNKKVVLKEAKKADLIIVSDYAKGAITAELMKILPRERKIIVDPKPKHKNFYKSVYLITPNKKEAFELSGCTEIYEAGKKLREELNSKIIITRGGEGMTIFNDGVKDIPTFAKEVYDVSGAGDTVVATLGLCLAAGANLEDASIIANHSAGIVVGKLGTASTNRLELRHRISGENQKIKSMNEIGKIILNEKMAGKKIIWTNGCFDILHQGHIKYLREAKKLGDILVVGLNSDESVKRLKGPNRPIQSEDARKEIISSLEFVDYVVVFNDVNVAKTLSIIKPHFFVKGENYNLKSINQQEKKVVESYNGKIVFIPMVEGMSATKIIKKLS